MNEFKLRELGYEWSVVYGVCPVLPQSQLGAPIAVYDDNEVAVDVAKQNSDDDISFSVIEIRHLRNIYSGEE